MSIGYYLLGKQRKHVLFRSDNRCLFQENCYQDSLATEIMFECFKNDLEKRKYSSFRQRITVVLFR